MKTKPATLALIATTLVAPAAFADTDYVAADSSRETRLCMIAAEGSRIQLISESRNQNVSLNRIAHNVYCNDKNIVAFAQDAGNLPVYTHLARYHNPHVEIYRTASLEK